VQSYEFGFEAVEDGERSTIGGGPLQYIINAFIVVILHRPMFPTGLSLCPLYETCDSPFATSVPPHRGFGEETFLVLELSPYASQLFSNSVDVQYRVIHFPKATHQPHDWNFYCQAEAHGWIIHKFRNYRILFYFLDRAFSVMKRNKPTKCTINSYINLLLFDHSNMFRPLTRSHHQGVRNSSGLQGNCGELQECCYVDVFLTWFDCYGMQCNAITPRQKHIYITTFLQIA
jgi:hypothetical protein